MVIFSLVFVVVTVRLACAQDSNCDYYQEVQAGKTYYVYNPEYPGKYTPGMQCRWIAMCPEGYNCQLNCTEIDLPESTSCHLDRLLISKSGDPQLSDAEYYCGRGQVSTDSTGERISIGLITDKAGPGGKFLCSLAAKPAASTEETCSCGYRKQNRIINGQETDINEFPMMAGLEDSRINEIKCGAVILSRRYLLTAAHCAFSMPTDSMAVIVGEHDIATEDSTATRSFRVEDVVTHPKYTDVNYDYDVAILKVSEDIEYSGLVGPVCLPFKFVDVDLAGAKLTILGWGTIIPFGQKSNTLQKVDVDVISQEACRTNVSSLSPRQLCTYTLGKDSCQDDSGGPLLYTEPSTGLLFNMGIVSYGQMCATKDKPAVNTRVTELLDWIVQNTPGADYCRK